MPDAMQTSRILRFEAFEVNLTTGELRKGGVRTRLAEQPFQILSALLERRGKLVTREALRERLWSDDTFVDFDRSLNIAVVKIREAGGRRPRPASCVRGRHIDGVTRRQSVLLYA